MSITSGFFDSTGGDRKYSAEQMTGMFEGILSDGIYESIGDRFAVTATGEGLTVTVGTGRALCKGHWIKNDETIAFTLSPANSQYPRQDRIMLRYDALSRKVDIVLLEGTPAQTPAAPAIVRTDSIWDLCLANIVIGAGVSVLSQTAISDYRGSTNCPWVTGVVKQVDTSQLFAQYQAAYAAQFAEFERYLALKQAQFNAWFADLTEELTVDTVLKKYQYVSEVTSSTRQISFGYGIPEYEKDDIVFVYANGIFLTGGEKSTSFGADYYIDGEGEEAKIMLKQSYSNTKFTVIVIKNVIGVDGAVSAGSPLLLVNGLYGTAGIPETPEE